MFVIDRSLYLSPEVVGEPGLRPLKEVDPFSLDHFMDWLGRQDGTKQYRFFCTDGSCLIGQYAADNGFGHLPYGDQARELRKRGPLYGDLGLSLVEFIAVSAPYEPGSHYHTMGGALSNARKLLAEREK